MSRAYKFKVNLLLNFVCISLAGCASGEGADDSMVATESVDDINSLIVEKAERLAEEGTFEQGDIYVDTIHYGKYSQTEEEEMLALCKFKNNVHVAGMDRTLAIVFAVETMDVIAYKNFGADEVNLQCVPTDGVTEILYEGSTTYQDITTEYKELYTIQGNEWVEIPLEDAEEQEKYIPAKEEVMAMRAKVLEGMTEAEIERLKENIKIANQTMEKAYLYDDLFGRLSDSSNLYWNYIEQKGEIQIGWELEDVADYDASSGLTYDEYAEMHGKPVTAYNRFDADNFIALMEEMRDSLKVELLKADFDCLIENMQSAKETHDVKYIREIYYILHDMDYFLLRYGIEDVGKYMDDLSTVSKFYGVLNIYELGENGPSNMIMAEAVVDFGEYKDYTIKLIMTEGEYYTEQETAPAGNIYEENYDGQYVLQVLDIDDNIVDKISLNQTLGYETINFPGKFTLCVSDYNADGFPDFTIGTYGSSGMNIFEIFSVDREEKIANIGHFADVSKEFSIYLEQEEGNTDFTSKTWNNATGEAEVVYWKWNAEEGRYVE